MPASAAQPDPAPGTLLAHAQRPSLLAKAYRRADEIDPGLHDLARARLPRTPPYVETSDNIRAVTEAPSSWEQALHRALGNGWIAPNPRSAVNAILFDIDNPDALDRREWLAGMGAPLPDIMQDWWSGRAHAALWVDPPVWLATATPKMRGTLAFAGSLMAAALGAELMPPTNLAKSPWAQASKLGGLRLFRGLAPASEIVWDAYVASGTDRLWNTVPGTGPAGLLEVIEALAPEYAAAARRPASRPRQRGEPSSRSRIEHVFDLVRWWAYDRGERDEHAILAEAERVNAGLADPLSPRPLRSTAKSIARFMRDRYRPGASARVNRGRDGDAAGDLDTLTRRQLAAHRSARANRDGTDGALAAALLRLQAAGKPVTQAALAREAGLSLRTIKGRWRTLVAVPGVVQNGAYKEMPPGAGFPGALPATSTSISESPSTPHDVVHGHAARVADPVASASPALVQRNIIRGAPGAGHVPLLDSADVPSPAPQGDRGNGIRRRSLSQAEARP